MGNRWQEIWSKKNATTEKLNTEDEKELIVELKRAVGFDFFGKGTTVLVEEFYNEYNYLKKILRLNGKAESVFEVGCGSGANLYFFIKDGFKVGGMDYSKNLLEIAKKVLSKDNVEELIFDEAINLPVDKKYDAVISSGVFQYFPSLDYAEKVLDKMLAKTKKSIGICRFLKEETKEEYLKFLKKNNPDYEERYKNLDKLFLSQEFFKTYAEKNNLEVKFDMYELKGFWNVPYMGGCFLYKKDL